MIDRCQNPKTQSYPRYGGRGIQVCPEWKASFWAFVESMGVRPTPQHSVDRINNNGDYTPGNCRWATPSQQRRNSTGRMHNVEAFGHTMIVTDWAEAYFIPHAVLTGRLRMGWEAERALLTPYTPRTKSRP